MQCIRFSRLGSLAMLESEAVRCFQCRGFGPFTLSHLSDICDKCCTENRAKRARRREAARKAQQTKAERQTEPRRKRFIGSHDITEEEYRSLLESQGGVCAICQNPPRTGRLVVDHDHTCHKPWGCRKCIRGLICITCNSGLGKLGDDIAGLERALTYLRAYEAGRKEARDDY